MIVQQAVSLHLAQIGRNSACVIMFFFIFLDLQLNNKTRVHFLVFLVIVETVLCLYLFVIVCDWL